MTLYSSKTHNTLTETWYYFAPQRQYERFLQETFDPVPFPDHLKGHSTSPFVWAETGEDQKMELLGSCMLCIAYMSFYNLHPLIKGGLDRFKTWAQKRLPKSDKSPKGNECKIFILEIVLKLLN